MLSLSRKWAPALLSQPETGMGYQVATVVLEDGRRFERVTIVGGTITSVGAIKSVPFSEGDIQKILVTHGR